MNSMMKKTVLASLIATLGATPILAEAHGGGGGVVVPGFAGRCDSLRRHASALLPA